MSRPELRQLEELAKKIQKHPALWGNTSDLRLELAEGLLECLPSFRITTPEDQIRIEDMIEHLERILVELEAERMVS